MEVFDAIPEKYRSWVNLPFLMISSRSLMLAWRASPNGDISKFGILRAWLGRIGIHQPLSTSFASLVASIVECLPDADLWLDFESWWRKSVMRVLSSAGWLPI